MIQLNGLRSKKSLISSKSAVDIWHLTFDIWHLTFVILFYSILKLRLKSEHKVFFFFKFFNFFSMMFLKWNKCLFHLKLTFKQSWKVNTLSMGSFRVNSEVSIWIGDEETNKAETKHFKKAQILLSSERLDGEG
jgi:hypothetical protein